jgi:hypothetical protein
MGSVHVPDCKVCKHKHINHVQYSHTRVSYVKYNTHDDCIIMLVHSAKCAEIVITMSIHE